jgi:hypothetical protein
MDPDASTAIGENMPRDSMLALIRPFRGECIGEAPSNEGPVNIHWSACRASDAVTKLQHFEAQGLLLHESLRALSSLTLAWRDQQVTTPPWPRTEGATPASGVASNQQFSVRVY